LSLIQIRGLTKLYRMGDSIVRALDGVDLDIERGEFVAITGASGSGKSTMMHLLGCLDRPNAGRYIFNGRDVSRLSDRQLANIRSREIGFVFQTFNLINRVSALDNVGVPLFYAREANTRSAARQALERVGLGPRAHHRSNELSGGERQRVAIARAIVNNPPLLLADEPTGNLDTRTGQQIMDIFHELNEQGVTIVLVTHEYDVARQAHRIVQMRDGKIVSDRPSAEVDGGEPRVTASQSDGRRAVRIAGGDAAATAVLDAPPDVMRDEAPDVEPTAAPKDALPADAPREVMPLATTTFVCGLLAALCLTAGAVAGITVARSGFNPAGMSPEEIRDNMPPGFVQNAAIASAGTLLAVILGLVTVVIAVLSAKRAKREIGVWTGRWRWRTGLACGLAVFVLPLGMLAFNLVRRMMA
jgi:putative ABC transport system ATP-binding protein